MTDALDLEVALRTMHELGLADGDLGYAYWHQVAELLKSAADMRARLQELQQRSPSMEGSLSSGAAEQQPAPCLLHNLLSSAYERRRRAVQEARERNEPQVATDAKDLLSFDARHIDSVARSSTASIDARATAAVDEAEQLSLCVDYYVLNSEVSPRQTLERYRIECELPVGDEKSDVNSPVAERG